MFWGKGCKSCWQLQKDNLANCSCYTVKKKHNNQYSWSAYSVPSLDSVMGIQRSIVLALNIMEFVIWAKNNNSQKKTISLGQQWNTKGVWRWKKRIQQSWCHPNPKISWHLLYNVAYSFVIFMPVFCNSPILSKYWLSANYILGILFDTEKNMEKTNIIPALITCTF